MNSRETWAAKLRESRDFYTTSSLKDLLFHSQEHHFDLVKIKNLISNLNLEFITFEIADARIGDYFKKMFPKTDAAFDINSWHQFELKHPYAFIDMYQFWVLKQT